MRIHTLILLLMSLIASTFTTNAQSFNFNYDHYSIVVTDVNKSAEFYADILRLQEIPHPDLTPGFRWFSVNEHSQIHLIEKEFTPFEKNKSVHLALTTQDLDRIVKHLESKSVEYSDWGGMKNTIGRRSDGAAQIYIQDPDGYWIELIQLDREIKF